MPSPGMLRSRCPVAAGMFFGSTLHTLPSLLLIGTARPWGLSMLEATGSAGAEIRGRMAGSD